jgi:hypothetical protein
MRAEEWMFEYHIFKLAVTFSQFFVSYQQPSTGARSSQTCTRHTFLLHIFPHQRDDNKLTVDTKRFSLSLSLDHHSSHPAFSSCISHTRISNVPAGKVNNTRTLFIRSLSTIRDLWTNASLRRAKDCKMSPCHSGWNERERVRERERYFSRWCSLSSAYTLWGTWTFFSLYNFSRAGEENFRVWATHAHTHSECWRIRNDYTSTKAMSKSCLCVCPCEVVSWSSAKTLPPSLEVRQ